MNVTVKNPKSTILNKEDLPLGMWRDPKDGIVKLRAGRPRKNTQGKGPHQTRLSYDLPFAGGRRYRVTFTSQSSPDIYFQVDIQQTSLRRLLTELAYHIGKYRKPDCAKHFVATFEAYINDQNMVDAAIQYAENGPMPGPPKLRTPKALAVGAMDEDMEDL